MSMSQEVLHIIASTTMGVIGSIAGFLVGDGKGVKSLVAAGFVGGVTAYTIPPIIILVIHAYTELKIDEHVAMSISGFVGAISWSLLISLKATIPNLLGAWSLNYGSNRSKESNKKDK